MSSVVVTGASSGIGEAIARRFVADGWSVLTGSRSAPDLDDAEWLRTNVADPAGADALVAAAVEQFGSLDVVVNNAGVQVEKTVADTTDEEFDHVIDVNVRGVFNMCRAGVRQMAGQPDGGRDPRRDEAGGHVVPPVRPRDGARREQGGAECDEDRADREDQVPKDHPGSLSTAAIASGRAKTIAWSPGARADPRRAP